MAEAEETGKIKGLLANDRMNKIYYLAYLERSPLATAKRLVSLNKVRGFGNAAVAVENKSAALCSDEIKEKRLSLFTEGAKVFDDQGNLLGRAKDLEFEADGRILFLVTETEKYPPEKIASFSDGVVVIGKKPVRPKPPKKISKKVGDLRTISALSESEGGITPPRIVSDYSFLEGRTLAEDVYDAQNNLLAAKNTVIDKETVKRAGKHFRLVDLAIRSVEK